VLFPKGTRLPAVGAKPLAIERTYRPVHNLGHFRYIECSHRADDGKPTGDIAVWDEIRFPFDPALSEAADLQTVAVNHSPGVENQCIRERYTCSPSGAVEVEISNITSGYTRRYRLGRWAGKDTPIVPGKKRKSRAEGR
jgi:hypothetical protein